MQTQIGDTVVIRNMESLMAGVKSLYGKQYLMVTIARNIEEDRFVTMEIIKLSPKKYQLTYISTEENSYDLTDLNVTFTPDWYRTSILNNVELVEYENELLGICSELNIKE